MAESRLNGFFSLSGKPKLTAGLEKDKELEYNPKVFELSEIVIVALFTRSEENNTNKVKNMLRIKLARFGKKDQPHYRIVVTERKSKRDGQYQAQVGTYVPTQEPKILEINKEALAEWIGKGAQPTDTVANLIKRFESGNPFPAKKPRPSKKAQAKAAAAKAEAETAKEAPAAPEKTETPDTDPAETPVSEATEAPATEEKAAE